MTDSIMKTVRKDVPITEKQVEEALASYWANKAAIIWSADDMHLAANNTGRALTEGQAALLVQRVCRDHDASIGVSWQTLEISASEAGRVLTPDERASRDFDDGQGNLIVAAS